MNHTNRQNSVLTDLSVLPLFSAEVVEKWRRAVVVAPHPDDESLGCGGAIALMRDKNIPVFVLTLTDGTMSHPRSKKFPAAKLRDLREAETLEALKILGVEKQNARFLRFKDRSLPANENAENWRAAVTACREFFCETKIETIFVPWRRDPHPDHSAAWQIVQTAIDGFAAKPRVLEYPIWLWESDADAPLKTEAKAFRLDISNARERKQNAIQAHRSQITDLIDDDSTGFRLSLEILQHFAGSEEIYLTTNEDFY
jgi:LmbE family N-acetylglucosaminyl deacetylase